MEKSMQQDIRLRNLLSAGALSSNDLQERLSMSQTALSRAIQRNRKALLVLGAARSTRYALRENLGTLGTNIPVYEIDQAGDVRPYAHLHTLAGRQYGWELTDQKTQLLDYLPFKIQNARPEGFMGRAFAHSFAKRLGLPAKINDWSDRDLVSALAQRGEDFMARQQNLWRYSGSGNLPSS